MDIVEINKMTQRKKVGSATDHLYELCKITKEEALTLIMYSCRKEYGVMKTADIIHALGVEKIKV